MRCDSPLINGTDECRNNVKSGDKFWLPAMPLVTTLRPAPGEARSKSALEELGERYMQVCLALLDAIGAVIRLRFTERRFAIFIENLMNIYCQRPRRLPNLFA